MVKRKFTVSVISNEFRKDPVQGVNHQEDLYCANHQDGSAKEEAKTAPEGGWGWVVVLSTFLNVTMIVGIIGTFGIYYINLQDRLQTSLTTLSWIGAIYNGFGLVGALLAPLTIDKWGHRVTGCIGATFMASGFIASAFANNVFILYVTLGALPGIGTNILMINNLAIVGKYFNSKRPFAVALCSCGGGFGLVVYPLLIVYLVSSYGLSGAFLLHGGTILNSYCCSFTYWLPAYKGNVPVKPASSSKFRLKDYLQLLKTLKMILLCLTVLCYDFVLSVYAALVPSSALQQIPDLTQEQVAWVLLAGGLVGILGRLTVGVISTCLPKSLIALWLMSMWGCAACMAVLRVCESYPALMATGVFYSFFQGGITSLFPSVTARLHGVAVFAYAYSVGMMTSTVGGLFGVPLASFLAERVGNAVIFYMPVVGFTMAGFAQVPLFIKDIKTQSSRVHSVIK